MFLATIGIVAHDAGAPLPAGTFISSQCVMDVYNGNPSGPVYGNFGYEVTRANGSGGTYSTIEGSNTGGCFHPSGMTYFSNSDTIYFMGPYGDVNVGTSNYGEYADGNGGSYTDSSNSYNAGCGGTYATQEGYDEATGYPMTTYWKIDCANNTYYTNAFINAGYVLSEECSAGSSTDAAGNTWNMGSTLRVISDGGGGSYSENFYGIYPCGPYPSGYAYSYTSGSAQFYYALNGSGEYNQIFTYGTSWSGTFSDGTYDGSYSSAETNVHYPAGYVFYSYYDSAGARNVFYHFDGVSGYYETNDGA